MKKLYLLLIFSVSGFMVSGCGTSKPQSLVNYTARTDYVVGRLYELNAPAFLFKNNKRDADEIASLEPLGASGTSTNLETFKIRMHGNNQVAGLLLPGERIRVTKFVENKSMIVGVFLKVFATIESGAFAGTVLELSMISKDRQPSYNVFIDPEYLRPVKTTNP